MVWATRWYFSAPSRIAPVFIWPTSARWISCDDKRVLADFEKSAAGHNIAFDAAGNMAYLASSGVNLRLTQERWPKITFHATREHSVKVG